MKKALSVLLTAAMAASMMAGCGSSSDGAASGTTTDNGAAAGTESAEPQRQMARAFKIAVPTDYRSSSDLRYSSYERSTDCC